MNGRQPFHTSDMHSATGERTLLKARVSYSNGAISTSCTVVQISATGARLKVANSFLMPETFDIAIPQKGISCRAKLVWREESLTGVEFLSDAELPAATTESYLTKIKALEMLNARLTAQVGELVAQVGRLTEDS